eukprot:288434-Chlamydomonas_euryale.AAC.2
MTHAAGSCGCRRCQTAAAIAAAPAAALAMSMQHKLHSQFTCGVKMIGIAIKPGLLTKGSRLPFQKPSRSVILMGIPNSHNRPLGRGGVATRRDDS